MQIQAFTPRGHLRRPVHLSACFQKAHAQWAKLGILCVHVERRLQSMIAQRASLTQSRERKQFVNRGLVFSFTCCFSWKPWWAHIPMSFPERQNWNRIVPHMHSCTWSPNKAACDLLIRYLWMKTVRRWTPAAVEGVNVTWIELCHGYAVMIWTNFPLVLTYWCTSCFNLLIRNESVV